MNTPANTNAPKEAGAGVAQATAPLNCSRCDRRLPPDSPHQLCPYCLLAAEDPTTPWSTGHRFADCRAPAASELQPFFESLEIGPLIGHGGMGAVYRAHQHSLGRDVALKILLPEVAATEGFTDRFLREARALARLGHPNVVAVYDHGTAGPYAYLVMELVEGINLRELMAGEKLAVDDALRIVPQLCDALQFAHGRGVIHRDIKPENILIEESGHVKITDFGLAKLGEVDDRLGRTGTRQVMGTVHYMAPEQIERPREVDHRADLYSLGVVFYELLTGELPIGRFSPPSTKAGSSRHVDHVVMKSLEKEPDRRYDSADEVRGDLDRGSRTTSEQAKAAAAAIDQTVRRTTGAIWDAAAGSPPPWSPTGVLIATLAFYFMIVVMVTVVFGSRDMLPPMLACAAIAWVASYGLDRLYGVSPLPASVALLAVPVRWIARAPNRLFDRAVETAKSIEGLKPAWFVAASVAFAIALFCLVATFAIDVDYMAGLFVAAPLAWWLTRMSLPRGGLPNTTAAKLLVYPPILLTLVPIATILLVWPVFAWIAMIINTPPEWFTYGTGIGVDIDGARYSQNFLAMRAQLFGGLTIEASWLATLALLNAVFPDQSRWLVRPLLDQWKGAGRWLLLAICCAALLLFSLLWAI